MLVSKMHLLNLMSVVAFDQSQTQFSMANIQAERLKSLKAIQAPSIEDIVLGQCLRESSGVSYVASAFAVNTSQWEGVPFILR